MNEREVRRDRALLYAAAFLRAVSTSVVGVLLGVYLGRLGLSTAAIGAVIAAGLGSGALAALAATFFADRLGRRRFLFALTALQVAGTLLFVAAHDFVTLSLAAFLGMLNGMGKDRSAALTLETAALPATTTPAGRTRIIAGYTMLQDLGHALGAVLAGAPAWLAGRGSTLEGGYRVTFVACALAGVVTMLLYVRLGSVVEQGAVPRRAPLSAASRSLLARISGLFAVDALAGGFLTTALLSYFFFVRFGVAETTIGALFFGARLLNAFSHLGAAWLARRIGLVNTMVFTHIPSSLLLVAVAFAPSFAAAALLFLAREALVEMDVPTRQSYVLAVVAPEERTVASGVTNLVRLAGWAVAPAFAGALMQGGSLYLPLLLGAVLKITYDLMLWAAFRGVRPPEEC